MSSRNHLMADIAKTDKGIEIAPYHSPLAPKSAGYNCLILDVFDTETLMARGADDPNIPRELLRNIEQVDIVGSATEIASLIDVKDHSTFDYIISSHNFEHLANPVKFLQACEKLLKSGGIIKMAVPDCRACFDYYRPATLLPEWLAAYREERQKPSPEQVFAMSAYTSVLNRKDKERTAFSLHEVMGNISIKGNLENAFSAWQDASSNADYMDAHCTVMTPASLRLLLEECRQLQLIKLEIVEISATYGCEFYITLRNSESNTVDLPSPEVFQKRRTGLARMAARERAEAYTVSPLIWRIKRTYAKIERKFG